MSDAVAHVRPLLHAVADPQRAAPMAAYMKDIAPFLGVTSTVRRAATRQWLRSFDPGPRGEALLGAARELVDEPEREFGYVAIDLVRRHERVLPETSLGPLRDLALTRPWWDTVDAWATQIGRLGLRHTSWDRQVAGWATDPELWARRIALVFQVSRGQRVDLPLLFAACEATMGDRDFFMRKGIGWGLRDAGRAYPEQVRAFVAEHRAQLSPLSVREALKHL